MDGASSRRYLNIYLASPLHHRQCRISPTETEVEVIQKNEILEEKTIPRKEDRSSMQSNSHPWSNLSSLSINFKIYMYD
jgi:hypothetical protein